MDTIESIQEVPRLLTSSQPAVASEAFEELRALHHELRYAASMRLEPLREMNLKRLLMEVVYDTKDATDIWFVQMAEAKLKNILVRRFIVPKHYHALRTSVKSIRSGMLDPAIRRIRSYPPLLFDPSGTNPEQLEIEDPTVAPEKFVGFEDEVETLIASVLEETEELRVIAITGMPGIGKTMLASRIYQDERIRSRIPTLIWVHDVPPKLGLKDLCLVILRQLIKQGTVRYQELVMLLDAPERARGNSSCLELLNEFSENDTLTLISAVRGYLKKSIFFLVADGVWDRESLSRIMEILPNKGKVMITSRDSRITRKYQPPHVLRFMNERETWELLQLEVFGELDGCPERLRSTGKRIAKECGGSPLAVVAVASSLVVGYSTEAAQDLTEEWWKTVSENVATYVADYGAQHNVFERVELSYRKLPEHLQNCLLYLGMFPENHEISVRTLTRLWIAEGFVVRDERQLTLEEIAEEYLKDLTVRNLVVVRKTYPNGRIKTCSLHVLIHGFCKHKAAEQDFYQEIRTSPVSLLPCCRRLCIYSSLSEVLSGTRKEQRVRSILCHNRGEKVVPRRKDIATIHKHFKFLRVLECRYINFTKFHGWFTKLRLLRHISISCDELHLIPATISSLFYLETLVVETRSPSLEIKANIWRMLMLRNLVTKAAIRLSIEGEGEEPHVNLQTLTRLAPACCTDNVFTRAPKLKTLGIRGQLSALSGTNSMKELQFLENMKLINEPAADTQLCLNCFPSNLKKLTLSGTYMGWGSMSALGRIDGLESLKLKDNAFNRGSWKTDANGFSRLGFLLIESIELVSWEASDDCFPALKCLVLKKCGEIVEIPSVLAKRLDTLDVENVSDSAVESAKDIEQGIRRRQGQNKGW